MWVRWDATGMGKDRVFLEFLRWHHVWSRLDCMLDRNRVPTTSLPTHQLLTQLPDVPTALRINVPSRFYFRSWTNSVMKMRANLFFLFIIQPELNKLTNIFTIDRRKIEAIKDRSLWINCTLIGLMEASYGDQVTAIITYNLNSAWLSIETLELPFISTKSKRFLTTSTSLMPFWLRELLIFFTQSDTKLSAILVVTSCRNK